MSIRVDYEDVKKTVKQAFLNLGLTEEQAETCAVIHTQSSADGVESHGLNRIPRFAEYVQKGWINLEDNRSLQVQKGRWRITTDSLGSALQMHCFALTVQLNWQRSMESAALL